MRALSRPFQDFKRPEAGSEIVILLYFYCYNWRHSIKSGFTAGNVLGVLLYLHLRMELPGRWSVSRRHVTYSFIYNCAAFQ